MLLSVTAGETQGGNWFSVAPWLTGSSSFNGLGRTAWSARATCVARLRKSNTMDVVRTSGHATAECQVPRNAPRLHSS